MGKFNNHYLYYYLLTLKINYLASFIIIQFIFYFLSISFIFYCFIHFNYYDNLIQNAYHQIFILINTLSIFHSNQNKFIFTKTDH